MTTWSALLLCSRRAAKATGVRHCHSLVKRPVCYLDLTLDKQSIGRVEIELRNDIVPKTAENFRALCTGEKGIGYKGTRFHRVLKGFMMQGGDVTHGEGPRSIYGKHFFDENFILEHDDEGVVGMANGGPDTNACQFYITVAVAGWLDGSSVAFGKVIKGLPLVKGIVQEFSTSGGTPKKSVIISECGELLWSFPII